jgi:hypothetical protein
MSRTPHPYGSPQLGPFAPPPPPPPTQRHRPWLLPVAIGCGVVLLVTIGTVVGAAVAKFPTVSTTDTSTTCRVGSVCATVDGVSLVLTQIDRSYQSPPQTPTAVPFPSDSPLPGFHVVRVEVRFRVDGQGQHEVFPDEVLVLDSQGQPQLPYGFFDATCTTSLGGAYGPGTIVGPTPLCVQVAGPAHATLTLYWAGVNINLP